MNKLFPLLVLLSFGLSNIHFNTRHDDEIPSAASLIYMGEINLLNSRDYLETFSLNQTWVDSLWRNNSLETIISYNDMNLPIEVISQYYLYPDYTELQNSSKRNYNYNENGDIVYELYSTWGWNEEQWINIYKNEKTYDSDFQILTNTRWNWENDDWVINSETIYEYNIFGYLNYYKFSIWIDGVWSILAEYSYNYNDEGEWLSLDMYNYDYTDSLYYTKRMTDISDSEGQWLYLTEVLIDDTLWVNESLSENFYIIIDDRYYIDYYTIKSWENSEWVNQTRGEYSYTGPDYDIAYFGYYNWIDSNWDCLTSTEFTYNENYDIATELIGQAQDGSEDCINRDFYTYTYDDNYNQNEFLRQQWEYGNYWAEKVIVK